jgi:hypothetical protein
MTAARRTAPRAAAVARDPSSAVSPRPAVPGAITTSARIDEDFLGRSLGNLADYAIRTGQLHQTAARKLRSIASISARDPRCIFALGDDGALVGGNLVGSAQIIGAFRTAVSKLEALGTGAIPVPMRPRVLTAGKLARSSTASMKQIAIIADALSQDFYAFGDPMGAYRFAAMSGQAVNRVVSLRTNIAARLDNVELR